VYPKRSWLEARLRSLVLLDESYSGSVLGDQDPEQTIRFVPCVLKKPFQMSWCMDALLDETMGGYWQCWVFQPVLHWKDFIHGRFVGREEERNRTKQFFHDILTSKILIASFIAHEIYQRLVANGAEEAKNWEGSQIVAGNNSRLSFVQAAQLRMRMFGPPFITVAIVGRTDKSKTFSQ
jgi:hypothetical protein